MTSNICPLGIFTIKNLNFVFLYQVTPTSTDCFLRVQTNIEQNKIKIYCIVSVREIRFKCIFKANFLLPRGFDAGALIPQVLAGSPNHSEVLHNLVTLINCGSLKEIGEMACVTPAWSSRGRTLNFNVHDYYKS